MNSVYTLLGFLHAFFDEPHIQMLQLPSDSAMRCDRVFQIDTVECSTDYQENRGSLTFHSLQIITP